MIRQRRPRFHDCSSCNNQSSCSSSCCSTQKDCRNRPFDCDCQPSFNDRQCGGCCDDCGPKMCFPKRKLPSRCKPQTCDGNVVIGSTPTPPPVICCDYLTDPFSRPLGSYGESVGCYYDKLEGLIKPVVNSSGQPIDFYSFTTDIINEGSRSGVIDVSAVAGGSLTYKARWGVTKDEVISSDWSDLPTSHDVSFSYIQHKIEVLT